MKVYLSAMAYELGHLLDISSLDELCDKQEVLEQFLALGLEKYSHSHISPIEMAKKSANKTLEKSSIKRSEIDAVVYATNSFWNPDFYSRQAIGQFLLDLELVNAYPIGVFFSDCSNAHSALRVAKNLVKSEDCSNVLVVTTDANRPEESRILQPNISINSDGAASCIISSQPEGDFEILKITQHTDADMACIDPSKQILEYFEGITAGVRFAVLKSMSHVKATPKEFKKVIINNYNSSVNQTFCSILELQDSQVFTDNLSRFAHAISADNLINLSDLLDQSSIGSQDLMLLIGTGPNAWGSTILCKV